MITKSKSNTSKQNQSNYKIHKNTNAKNKIIISKSNTSKQNQINYKTYKKY